MKRVVTALLALAVLAALAIVTTTSKHSVRAVYAQSGCSVATLNGNYALNSSGFTTHGRGPGKGADVPVANVGIETFDGAGTTSASFTNAFNGAISPLTAEGTYTSNSDCTGSISLPGVGTFNTVIIGGGAEIFGIVTTPTWTYTLDWKKQ